MLEKDKKNFQLRTNLYETFEAEVMENQLIKAVKPRYSEIDRQTETEKERERKRKLNRRFASN